MLKPFVTGSWLPNKECIFLESAKLALEGLGLSELRAILFLHWRVLRHGYGGGEPSQQEMVYTLRLIDAIRIILPV